MFKKITSANLTKIETTEITHSSFYPILHFYANLNQTKTILKEAAHNKQLPPEGCPFFDEKELIEIADIYEQLGDMPLSNIEIMEYNINDQQDLQKLQKYLDLSQKLQLELDKVKFSAITRSFNESDLGKSLLNKSIKVIKCYGGTGATTITTQIAIWHALKGKTCYIEFDTQKINILTGEASQMMGDGENIIKQYFKKKPKAKLKKEGYTIDMSTRRGWLTREEEFKLFHHTCTIPDVNLDLVKFLKLSAVETTNSLDLMLQLFIDFAEQLDRYEYIIIDDGPLNTLSYGFFSYFLKNHLLTIPFDDVDVSKIIYPQEEMESSATFYRDLIEDMKKLYEKIAPNYEINHNLILVLNERTSTEEKKEESIPNYKTSKNFEKISNNLSIYEQTFQQRGLKNENNTPLERLNANIKAVPVPFYWQPYLDNNRSNMVTIPLLFEAGEQENIYFKNTILKIDNILSKLSRGYALEETEDE